MFKRVKTLLGAKHVFRKIECFVKIKHVLKIEKRIKHSKNISKNIVKT